MDRETKSSGLLTDLYELTMAAGYFQRSRATKATFDLFVRRLPAQRNYLVAAGLEPALAFLENVRFSAAEVSYLRRHPMFAHIGPAFFDSLRRFRFTGDVWAIPEGRVVFPGEPLLRVTAPIIQAQLVETCLLATLGYSTVVASKSARLATAAQGRPVVDFSPRRAPGAAASLLCTRAAIIGGCTGTSLTLAGQRFGIATSGTQAHSWIMAHRTESEAFRRFLDCFPLSATLLVDTYQLRHAVRTIISGGRKPAAIRLDSGDLCGDSRWARRELDRAGWPEVKIFASGDLDELKITALLAAGAAIDGFGVGTALGIPADAPHIELIYKLVEVMRRGKTREVAKFSPHKATYPGRKQVFRQASAKGIFRRDVIALAAEPAAVGEPLLVSVMRRGQRVMPAESLPIMRQRCRLDLERLPSALLRLDHQAAYPVRYSPRLREMLRQVRRAVPASVLR